MNNFIYLPPCDGYNPLWINFDHVQNVIKTGEERVMIIYANGSKDSFEGIWAKVILDYFTKTHE